MRRRKFITLLSSALVAAPPTSRAQQPRRPIVGLISGDVPEAQMAGPDPVFLPALHLYAGMYLVIMLSYDVLNAKPLNWMSWYYLFAVAISKNFRRPRSPRAIISARSSVHVCVWRLANYTIQVGVSVCEFGMSIEFWDSTGSCTPARDRSGKLLSGAGYEMTAIGKKCT